MAIDVAKVADVAANVLDTPVILVSSVADKATIREVFAVMFVLATVIAEALAAIEVLATTMAEALASILVCSVPDTAAILLTSVADTVAILVAIVLDTVAILLSSVADTLAMLVASVADTAARSALVGTPDVEIIRSPEMLMLVPAVY